MTDSTRQFVGERHERHSSWWRNCEWPVVWALALVALVLGWIGFAKYHATAGHAYSPLEFFYRSLQLFVLNSGAVEGKAPWTLEVARFLAPAVAAYTATKTLMVVFRGQLLRLRLHRWHGHAVVCGLGRKGLQLVRDFRAQGRKVVVIDSDEHNDHLRLCRELGAIVLPGDATHVDLLREARVAAAGDVIATTGDDGVNVEIAVHTYQLFQTRRPQLTHKLQCLVHLVDTTLCSVFKQSPMFQTSTDKFEVKVFNIYENCARQLFDDHPLDRAPIGPASPVTAHLVVVGFGKMGQSVALQAARIGHFANSRKLRVTVVDKRADEVRAGFLALYPQFGQVCDVNFIQASARSVEVNEKLVGWAGERECLLTVAVCLDDDSRSLTRALGVAEKLHDDNVAILVRMEEDIGLASLLVCEGACHALVRRVTAFGQINRVCALERLMSDRQDRIARRMHEAYLTVARHDPNKRPDDEALKDWDQLPESYKDANRHVADHLDVKLRAVGVTTGQSLTRDFTADEIEILSRMEHARWLAERLLAGWRHGPPPKDERRKTNPNIVPWEQLDEVNKEKDRETVRALRQWLASPKPNG